MQTTYNIENKNIWYHGTISLTPLSFHPFSHFGSRLAASEAAARHFFHHQRDGSPKLIKVEISLNQNNYITLEDWGATNDISIALALKVYFEDKNLLLSDTFYRIWENATQRKQNGHPEKNSLLPEIQAKLISLGLDAIAYKNEVEGSENDFSVCIVNPSIIKTLDHENFTEQEWCDAGLTIEKMYRT